MIQIKTKGSEILAQVTCRGDQEITSVRGYAPGMADRPYIVARVGNVLLYWEDAESLQQWKDVVLAAASFVDSVFPDEGPKPYRPVKGGRKPS